MDSEQLSKEQEKTRLSWATNDEREIDDAIGQLLQHAHGRRLLYWLLEIGKAIGVNPFTGNALTTAFSCGEQSIGQQVMVRILTEHPDGFLEMLKERADERKSRTDTLRTDTDTATSDDGLDPYTDT